MAGFVLSTVPLFAGFGYLLGKSTTVLGGRLKLATGVVVLVIALGTAGSGLRLAGWLPDLPAAGHRRPPRPAPTPPAPNRSCSR